jgi:hypothetical protein
VIMSDSQNYLRGAAAFYFFIDDQLFMPNDTVQLHTICNALFTE